MTRPAGNRQARGAATAAPRASSCALGSRWLPTPAAGDQCADCPELAALHRRPGDMAGYATWIALRGLGRHARFLDASCGAWTS